LLAAVNLSSAKDHVWTLRDDPSYVIDTVNTLKGYRRDCIFETVEAPFSSKTNVSDVNCRVIMSAYLDFIFWDYISKLLTELEELCLTFDSGNRSQVWRYLETIDTTYYYLRLQKATITMPGLRDMFGGSPAFSPYLIATLDATGKKGAEISPPAPPVMSRIINAWLRISQVWNTEYVHLRLDELQTLLDKDDPINVWLIKESIGRSPHCRLSLSACIAFVCTPAIMDTVKGYHGWTVMQSPSR
jgi:hypothetical protein